MMMMVMMMISVDRLLVDQLTCFAVIIVDRFYRVRFIFRRLAQFPDICTIGLS